MLFIHKKAVAFADATVQSLTERYKEIRKRVTPIQSDPNHQTRRGFRKVKSLYTIYYDLKVNMISHMPVR